jgi:hypothetical protein
MTTVKVKGVANPLRFPDDMDITDIKKVLRNKFTADTMKPIRLNNIPNVAAPYEPSLSEKISQGIASYLLDKGFISDNYRAQEIGKNLSMIAEFLPGVGDATAGDEFGRALEKGNYGEAALHGVGTLPVIGDMAIFAGALAKNADLGLLGKAKKLEAKGANRDEIWKETGWFNDRGDWKFEISDHDSKFLPLGRQESFAGEFGQVIGHDELSKNYPDTENIDLLVGYNKDGPYGSYTPATPGDEYSFGASEEIAVNFPPDRKSTLLHEAQHAIQQREGFAKGGSPSAELVDSIKSSIISDIDDTLNKMESGELPYDYDEYSKLLREKTNTLVNLPSPHELYKRLAGESEARLVQKRMNLTPEERRARPPWLDLDVPEDELIYRKGITTSQ